MIKLVDIDYRLIHGQVVFGWVKWLNIEYIIVVDDKSASDSFAASMLKLGVPHGVEFRVLPESKTDAILTSEKVRNKNTMIVLPDVAEALRFVKKVPTEFVNISNTKQTEGATAYSNCCFLNEKQLTDIKEMMGMGIVIDAFPTPDSPSGIHLSKSL
ncbi:PTS sugar transporter subunit IIB [Anaeropeptidivorans aminofermentans]|uniref:PTS sugar transporter subunit IIB n=1 Tax=Anaeropeptidivorans aminofermentans TaxID=2934315 RepID=UPI00202481B9|nr:PTS sugar transporter subunit IIB [Anaeropeptidivorans aminofermentans]MBE6013132.1 PTS sugar transporter subunit IIB [Lachnospiraceae bacterium]